MTTEIAETNVYSQQDAAKFAQACQTDLLHDIEVATENYETLVVTARFTQEGSGEEKVINVLRDPDDNTTMVLCNGSRLTSHHMGTLKLYGDDEVNAHANKALAAAQRIFDTAELLQDRLLQDVNSQLVQSLTAHATRFSTPEGRQITIEEQ